MGVTAPALPGKRITHIPYRSCARQRAKAALQVRNQIVRILQPDVQPDGRAAGIPLGHGAVALDARNDGEALEAAPARSDAEDLKRIDESGDLPLRGGLEHDREQRRRAGEIALPDRVAGVVLQRWVDDTLHFR